jgi:hypothetical protein
VTSLLRAIKIALTVVARKPGSTHDDFISLTGNTIYCGLIKTIFEDLQYPHLDLSHAEYKCCSQHQYSGTNEPILPFYVDIPMAPRGIEIKSVGVQNSDEFRTAPVQVTVPEMNMFCRRLVSLFY